VKRGEFRTVSGGTEFTGKPRPALIVTDDFYSRSSSVVVCPLTTLPVNTPVLRIEVLPDTVNGLRRRSYIQIDKLGAVPVWKFGDRIGQLESSLMIEVDLALAAYLGLTK